MSGPTGGRTRAERWILPAAAPPPAGREAASAFLARCEDTDRRLLALVHGHGVDLGEAAWVIDLDAALAHWRLRAALAGDGAQAACSPESLERGVAALLAGPDGASDEARRIVAELPAQARARLQAVLDGRRVAAAGESSRPGLGVGSLVLVVLAVAAFLLYGVIRDANPLWHGKDLLRRGDYATARLAFQELGDLPEARGLTAIAWLAEGRYGEALEVLRTPGSASYLAAFRPIDTPLESIDADPESLALLPRGLITNNRPEFVYRAGPPGEVVLLGDAPDAAADKPRPVRIRVPDTRAGSSPIVALSWPSDFGPLPAGHYVWSVPGSELHPSTFTLLRDEQRAEIESHSRGRLSNDIPYPAIVFLRAHYFLRSHLYTQAGQLFSGLARRYPDQTYPREMVAQVAAALGVDPSAFLR